MPRQVSRGEVKMTEEDPVDFAVVVYREDDRWEVELLPVALVDDLTGLVHVLRQQPGIGGTIGLVAVDDEFFVALRLLGDEVRVFLSDLAASMDYPLARQVMEYLDVPIPKEDDAVEQILPVGDMSIFADLGLDEMELGALAGDPDFYPDELLASIAQRIGFARQFERALDDAL
jgi:putative tRNA adenosine deaminase-associated protein